MQVEHTRPGEITITGNIKTTSDYMEIRNLVTEYVGKGGTTLAFVILDSLSMPSSVIGFFVKLVKHDKVSLSMRIQDKRLLELLDELNLRTLFNARGLE